MNAEFQWWLLILGIVVGGALVYLVLADMGNDPPGPAESSGPNKSSEPNESSGPNRP